MSRTVEDEQFPNEKKIRFQSTAKVLFKNGNNIDDLMDYEASNMNNEPEKQAKSQSQTPSLLSFLQVEVTRGYLLEHDEERYSAKREKVYSFMKIPREVEKFMTYGFLQCTDSFLYVYIFLPMRFLLALWALITRPISKCFGLQNSSKTVLTPAEICDILKAAIVVICSMLMFYVDTNIMYHLIKSQSVIKLYIFYNMLEVADRLFSAFGQDTIDALFWTATEPRDRRTEHLGVIPHMIFAVAYVFLHSLLVLFQATTLNVAINSNNKALLTIMMSNNFVELKGSVFKKFDKNNLFQVSCSDVRERFHLVILLFVVTLQTMKEYSWKSERFWVLLPDCVVVLVAEIFVDWIKHAFITRFNELQLDVYRDYTTSLAYDMAQTRQKHAFSDHSDLVARRMGFIPLPLGVVMIRVLVQSVHINSFSSVLICVLGYLCIGSLKVLISIIILGMACYFIEQHKQEKALINSPFSNRTHSPSPLLNRGGAQKDTATSPLKPVILVDNNSSSKQTENSNAAFKSSNLTLNAGGDCTLGSTAIFANSTVDLKNATLNEELLKVEGDNIKIESVPKVDEIMTRSEPNINSEYIEEVTENPVYENCESGGLKKRAESEPFLASCGETENLS